MPIAHHWLFELYVFAGKRIRCTCMSIASCWCNPILSLHAHLQTPPRIPSKTEQPPFCICIDACKRGRNVHMRCSYSWGRLAISSKANMEGNTNWPHRKEGPKVQGEMEVNEAKSPTRGSPGSPELPTKGAPTSAKITQAITKWLENNQNAGGRGDRPMGCKKAKGADLDGGGQELEPNLFWAPSLRLHLRDHVARNVLRQNNDHNVNFGHMDLQ